MTDHRRLQRTLFRMQHDPGFALRLRQGDSAAIASTGLGSPELAMLREVPDAAVDADAGGRRRAQFLRNVSSEHALTVARSRSADPELLESFTSSARFHEAVSGDRSLPLAFAAHAHDRARIAGDVLLLSLARLEEALARARRTGFPRPRPPSGGVVLSSRAEILELPEGSLDAAIRLRQALDEGPIGDVALDSGSDAGSRVEHALVLGSAPHPPAPWIRGEASVELLSPLAGRLLLTARTPLDDAGLAACARELDAERSEVDEFLAGLQADGLIVRG